MKCREFLKQITAYPSASFQTLLEGKSKTDSDFDTLHPADADLLRHLSSCLICARTLESEQQFRALIKRHAPKVQAPESLLDKVLDLVALERLSEAMNPRIYESNTHSPIRHSTHSPFRPFAIPLAAVCVLALIALFSWVLWPFASLKGWWGSEPSTIFAVVDDHIRYLPSAEQRQIVSSSPAEVAAWFTGQLDFAIKIPEFNDLRLLGGRRCYLFGQRVALLFYEKGAKKLSLFILEDRHLNLDTLSWVNHANKKIGVAACKGYNLVFCRESGLAYVLVSDLPREMLSQLISQL